MSDLRDFTGKNRKFTGTTGQIVSDVTGTTANRVNTKGRFRYNSTIELMEYYNGTTWIVIDAPPTISAVSPTQINEGDTSTTFTVTGGNFSSSGLAVKLFNNSGTEISLSSVTRVSSSQATAVLTTTDLGSIDEPYDIQVVNGSGLSAILEDAISVNQSPVWSTSAGSLGTASTSAAFSATVVATDPESGDVDYEIATGSLPGGLSLNSETGAITGTFDGSGGYNSSGTTNNFTLRAYDTSSNTATRAFSILAKAADGSDSNSAAATAKAIYNLDSSFQGESANGYYWLDPGGTGTYKQQYYCRMDHGGGWVAVAWFMRESTGNNVYPMATTAARGTYPSSNPYTVPNGSVKVHNTAITALQPANNNSRYDYLFDHISYTNTYPSSGDAQYPSAGTTLSNDYDGGDGDLVSNFARSSDYFEHTRALAPAFAGGGSTNTMLFGNGKNNVNNIADYGWDNDSGVTLSNANHSGRYMDAGQSQVFDFNDNGGRSTAYSTLCDDGEAGPYMVYRDFNCYHNYLIIYVR